MWVEIKKAKYLYYPLAEKVFFTFCKLRNILRPFFSEIYYYNGYVLK